MANIVIKILKKIQSSGELTLGEISKILPRKHGDHRDFYPLAFIVANNLIDDQYFQKREAPDNKEQLLARELFVCHDAEKQASDSERTFTAMKDGDFLKDQSFSLSAKGSIYLSDYLTKRNDRLIALGTGILVGIVTAVFTALLTSATTST